MGRRQVELGALAVSQIRRRGINFVGGVALLVASVLAGWLWDAYGPAYTFGAGAVFTALAGLGLVLRRRDVAALNRPG